MTRSHSRRGKMKKQAGVVCRRFLPRWLASLVDQVAGMIEWVLFS